MEQLSFLCFSGARLVQELRSRFLVAGAIKASGFLWRNTTDMEGKDSDRRLGKPTRERLPVQRYGPWTKEKSRQLDH
jgi:hypothetical protein